MNRSLLDREETAALTHRLGRRRLVRTGGNPRPG